VSEPAKRRQPIIIGLANYLLLP